MFNRIVDSQSPLEMAGIITHELGLEPGLTCEVTISKGWASRDVTAATNINVSFDVADVSASALRKLKRHVKLEVPDWARKYANPALMGTFERLTSTGVRVTVYFSVGGAFKCEQVGTEEVLPREEEAQLAAKLAAMTPEEALAYVRAEADAKLTPRLRPRYHCVPATPGAKENS